MIEIAALAALYLAADTIKSIKYIQECRITYNPEGGEVLFKTDSGIEYSMELKEKPVTK